MYTVSNGRNCGLYFVLVPCFYLVGYMVIYTFSAIIVGYSFSGINLQMYKLCIGLPFIDSFSHCHRCGKTPFHILFLFSSGSPVAAPGATF